MAPEDVKGNSSPRTALRPFFGMATLLLWRRRLCGGLCIFSLGLRILFSRVSEPHTNSLKFHSFSPHGSVMTDENLMDMLDWLKGESKISTTFSAATWEEQWAELRNWGLKSFRKLLAANRLRSYREGDVGWVEGCLDKLSDLLGCCR